MAIPKPINAKRNRVRENMSPDGLTAFMNLHGISDKEMSEILGVTDQAVRLWRLGDREISVTNTRLFAMFARFPKLLKEF